MGKCYFCKEETEDIAKIDDKFEYCCEFCQEEQQNICDEGDW